jgi:hypothetical protein
MLARPSALDVQFVDYDGVRFHLSTPERKTFLLLSMSIRCWTELVQYGAYDVLKREYGSLVKSQAEPEYNVSLEIDLEQVPVEGGERLACPISSFVNLDNRSTRAFHQVHISLQTECVGCAIRARLQAPEGTRGVWDCPRRSDADSLSRRRSDLRASFA